jgi:hypothetical protein
LQERQAVIFGRASSCENPVMIRLNDRADFVRVFRGKQALLAVKPKDAGAAIEPKASIAGGGGERGIDG